MAFDFGNANEAQRSAISTTDGPLLIIAGPGTGKTYTLVKRIVYLITEKDVLPEEILIATFTEKAAKELITRITNELYAIGVSVNLNEMYIGKLVTNYRSERQIIDFYNKWMSTTDGRAYDFMWKNFRFEKKIVPPEGKKDAKVGVIKCSGKDLLDDWYEQVYSFITQLKSSGVLTDYNQIAVLCKSVKGDKIIGMVEYLEEHGIKVYSPRSEMFFERKEIKQVIGCMILCFPEYVRKLQQRDFSYDFENLYNYYDTQCIAAARDLILQYRDTLGNCDMRHYCRRKGDC